MTEPRRRRRSPRSLGTLGEYWNEGRRLARAGERVMANWQRGDRERFMYLGWKHERAVMRRLGKLPQGELPLRFVSDGVADSG